MYANAFRGAFQFDDATILADPRLEHASAYFGYLAGMIRPALKFTFLFDRMLWGGNPAGYHAINLLLHLASGLILYAMLRALVAEEGRGDAASDAVPFWSALLFLVHPIATETVTYVSGRASGLMAFFYLAAIHLYIRSTAAGAASAVPWRYFASIGCFLLALLSKETAITLPAALLLIDTVVRRRRWTNLRRAVVAEQLPFWGTLALFLAVAAHYTRYVHLLDASLDTRSLSANALTQVTVLPYALSLFVMPARLNFDHDLPLASAMSPWSIAAAAVVVAGLLVVAAGSARRHRLASFGLFWFFLQLLPTNSVLPRYDVLSERNLYLAGAGLFVAAVAGSADLFARAAGRRLVSAAGQGLAVTLVVLLGIATVARNTVYASPATLWADAARKSPLKARPHVNLGYAYYAAGDLDRAIVEFRAALAIDRDNPIAQANLLAAWREKRSMIERER